jgi:hypothetical protein
MLQLMTQQRGGGGWCPELGEMATKRRQALQGTLEAYSYFIVMSKCLHLRNIYYR